MNDQHHLKPIAEATRGIQPSSVWQQQHQQHQQQQQVQQHQQQQVQQQPLNWYWPNNHGHAHVVQQPQPMTDFRPYAVPNQQQQQQQPLLRNHPMTQESVGVISTSLWYNNNNNSNNDDGGMIKRMRTAVAVQEGRHSAFTTQIPGVDTSERSGMTPCAVPTFGSFGRNMPLSAAFTAPFYSASLPPQLQPQQQHAQQQPQQQQQQSWMSPASALRRATEAAVSSRFALTAQQQPPANSCLSPQITNNYFPPNFPFRFAQQHPQQHPTNNLSLAPPVTFASVGGGAAVAVAAPMASTTTNGQEQFLHQGAATTASAVCKKREEALKKFASTQHELRRRSGPLPEADNVATHPNLQAAAATTVPADNRVALTKTSQEPVTQSSKTFLPLKRTIHSVQQSEPRMDSAMETHRSPIVEVTYGKPFSNNEDSSDDEPIDVTHCQEKLPGSNCQDTQQEEKIVKSPLIGRNNNDKSSEQPKPPLTESCVEEFSFYTGPRGNHNLDSVEVSTQTTKTSEPSRQSTKKRSVSLRNMSSQQGHADQCHRTDHGGRRRSPRTVSNQQRSQEPSWVQDVEYCNVGRFDLTQKPSRDVLQLLDVSKAKVAIGAKHQAMVPATVAESLALDANNDEKFGDGDVLWDPYRAENSRQQGVSVDEYLANACDLNSFMTMMEELHKSDYCPEKGWEGFLKRCQTKDRRHEATIEIPDEKQSRFEEVFRRQRAAGKKDFVAASKELRRKKETIMVQYYRWKGKLHRNRGFKESKYCTVCQDGGFLIVCDSCHQPYHLNCHSPQLEKVPRGDWYCSYCRDRPLDRVEKHPCAVNQATTSNLKTM